MPSTCNRARTSSARRFSSSAHSANRALQTFLAMALYNTQQYKEAMELVLTNLLETTSDEKLQYFKRPLLYYASHLDETW